MKFPDRQSNLAERFPRSRTFNFETGGRPGVQVELELRQSGVYVSSFASDLLRSRQLQRPTPENITTILLRLEEAGIHDCVLWPQLVKHFKKQGLDLCPQLAGADMRSVYTDQPEGEWVAVLSEPIADRRGYPFVFALNRREGRLRLSGRWTDYPWHPDSLVACRLR